MPCYSVVAGLEKFQDVHGPKTRPAPICPSRSRVEKCHPLSKLADQIEYDLRRYRGTLKVTHQPLDPKMLELYKNKFKLIEFQLSPEESVKYKQSSKVYKCDFKEGDGSDPCVPHHMCKTGEKEAKETEDSKEAVSACPRCHY